MIQKDRKKDLHHRLMMVTVIVSEMRKTNTAVSTTH